MRKRHIALLAALLLPFCAPAEKIFEVDFDDYGVEPGLAKGRKNAYRFKDGDLQLRMFPGVNGKGNSINLANSECVEYLMPGNFDPRHGTVSLWVNPVNWKIYDSGWQTFFFAWQKDFELRINKLTPGYIEATIVNRPVGGKLQAVTVPARCDATNWEPGRWHRIDVTWNDETIKLYIDGRIPPKTPTQIGTNTRVRPTNPIRSFKSKQNLPTASGRFCVGTRHDWQTRKEVVRSDKTAIDSLTIHDRVLSGEEILKEYEKVFPPKATVNPKNYAEIPFQKSGAPDWGKALKMPIAALIKPVPQIRADLLAAHNGETLFLKYIIYQAPGKTTVTERDGELWYDDSVEFHISAHDGKQQNQYIVNSNGVLFDSKNLEKNWNGDAKVTASKTADSWTVEMAIPLAELGGKELIGKELKAEFCVSIQDGRKQRYYHWGNYTGTVYETRDIIKLAEDDAYYQLDLNAPQLNTGVLNLSGRGDLKDATVTAKITPAGYSDLPYPGDFRGVTWKRQLPAGGQKLAVESKRFRYYYGFSVNYPLEVGVNCDPDTGVLKLDLDLSNAGDAVQEALRKGAIGGSVKLLDPAGKSVAESTFRLTALKGAAQIALPKSPASGTYTVVVSTTGETTSFTRKTPFRVPDMTPFELRLGVDHTIPDPWLPLEEIGKDRYQTRTGTVQVGPGAFPSRLTNGDTELLSSAPVWTLNGQPVKWSGLKRKEKFDDYVVYTGTGKAGTLRIDWRGELWFDGAWILKFQLIPTAGKAKIDRFEIRYKVPPIAGEFAMDPIYVPFKDNAVAIALGGDARRKDNILWLSGHEKGVFFWVKSNANWVNRRDEKPLTARKDDTGTTALLKVISRPAELTRPAEYTMVFMGTPSRTPMKAARGVNYHGYLRNSHCNYQTTNGSSFRNNASDDDMTSVTSCKPMYPDAFRKELQPYRERNIKIHIYTMPGQISSLEPEYDFIGKNNWSTPRVNHSSVKLGQPWILDYFCFNATDRTADWWCYNLDRTMKEYAPLVDGPYFDVASTKFCENRIHGCGGKDAFGQEYNSSDALGLRNFLMRVYKTVHRRGGSIMLHSHVQFLPMSHAFIDMFAPGENTFHTMAKNLDYGYCEDIPLEQYQTDFNWKKAGVPYCHIIQTGRVCRFTPAFKKFRTKVENSPEYALRALTPAIVHDFNTWPTFVYNPTVNHWWGVRKEVGITGDVDFVGYWANRAVKPLAPKTYCSYYVFRSPDAPYRRLLMIGNFNRFPVKAACEFDFKALGVEKPATVTELWCNKQKKGETTRINRELALDKIADIEIPGNHFILIGIK